MENQKIKQEEATKFETPLLFFSSPYSLSIKKFDDDDVALLMAGKKNKQRQFCL